ISENSSFIDNEITEMHCSARIIDRESRYIHIYLIRDCISRKRKTLIISEALQELSARIYKKLLIKRLTVKRETTLLK
ncbi:hypothetical protein BDDG_13662, partial [Blastomyces dermatitidis ATCC 18188]